MTAIYSAMPQAGVWDREYRDPKLLKFHDAPQPDVTRFLRFLKKNSVEIDGLRVLDVGSGTGRNANELATRGARVLGFEIAPTAIKIALLAARRLGVEVDYRLKNFGEPWTEIADGSLDLVLDITSSNSLSESERQVYIAELLRTLRPGGWLFLKTLAKDGDKNAENLLRQSPGPEKDTYILPGLRLIERVLSRADLLELYRDFGEPRFLERKISYTKMGKNAYRRHFWLAYFQKPS